MDIQICRAVRSKLPTHETLKDVHSVEIGGVKIFVKEGQVKINGDITLELINEPYHGYQGLVIKAVSDGF